MGAVNEQSEHLTDAQIENYGEGISGAGAEPDVVEEHLAKCPACCERLLSFQRVQMGLLEEPELAGSGLPISRDFPALSGSDSLKDQNVNRATTSACPSKSDLRDLAAGVCPEETASTLIQHAATCDRCGALLRTYAEDFSEDLSEDEEALLQKTKAALPEWHKQTAREMMKAGGMETPAGAERGATLGGELRIDRELRVERSDERAARPEKPPRRRFPWKWALIPATTAACAVIAFGLWYRQRDTPEKVEKLLAQAYTEQRTMEMRWPGAEHADFNQERSGNRESMLTSPAALRKAADLIDSHLKKNPDDPTWLLLSARFKVMEWNYNPALMALDKIEDDKVINSPDMRMTRALALYEQAELEPERKAQSYGEIINIMGKTLQETPQDPSALFNRATACEKIQAYECAVDDYQRLLALEKSGKWSHEAADHLNRIREKKTPDR